MIIFIIYDFFAGFIIYYCALPTALHFFYSVKSITLNIAGPAILGHNTNTILIIINYVLTWCIKYLWCNWIISSCTKCFLTMYYWLRSRVLGNMKSSWKNRKKRENTDMMCWSISDQLHKHTILLVRKTLRAMNQWHQAMSTCLLLMFNTSENLILVAYDVVF